jgi:hypothetical protein
LLDRASLAGSLGINGVLSIVFGVVILIWAAPGVTRVKDRILVAY